MSENEALAGQVRGMRSELDLLDQVVRDLMHPTTAAGGDQAAGGEAPFAPLYPALELWVVDCFAPMFPRPLSPTVRWCAQWWDHAEAISRLEALWRTWEVARLDELRGVASWYRDHLDPQLAVLLSAGGPFAQCTQDRHAPTQPLATLPAPEGYWTSSEPADPASEPHPMEQQR